jgi:hypothetical protein
MKNKNGYCEDKMLLELLYSSIRTFKIKKHFDAITLLCKNVFPKYDTIWENNEDNLIQEASTENPIAKQFMPLL